ncbi:MAG: CHAT domain-containing protein [Bacteroidetes bacterium]|nr:CHAT domain-containing protein [Bacteroidota bacterium]
MIHFAVKNTFLVFIGIQIGICVHAQNSESDTLRAKRYFEQAGEYDNKSKRDSASIFYAMSANIYWDAFSQMNDTGLIEKYLLCKNNIAWNLTSAGKPDLAIPVLDSAIVAADKFLLHQQFVTAVIYNTLGYAFERKGDYDHALENKVKALEMKLILFGDDYYSVGDSYLNVGVTYYYKGDYQKALEYMKKGLNIYLRVYGTKHKATASAYNNIGNTLSRNGENVQALEYKKKALDIRLELLGDQHPAVADMYNNIGVTYFSIGEYELALEYYFKALEIRKNNYGEKHYSVAASICNIGAVYNQTGDYKKALEYNTLGLELRIELLGEKHPSVASSYNNIGYGYNGAGEFAKAREFYSKACDFYLETLGEKHPFLAMAYNNIGLAFKNQGRLSEALHAFQMAISVNTTAFIDTANVFAEPLLMDFLDTKEILISLKGKASVFFLKFMNNKAETSSLQEAFYIYLLCDSIIDQARRRMVDPGDKLQLTESADNIYIAASNVYASVISNENALGEESKEMLYYFAEKSKGMVLLESMTGADAIQTAGIPNELKHLVHAYSKDIRFCEQKLAGGLDSATGAVFRGRLFALNRTYDSLMNVFETQYPDYHNLRYNFQVASITDIQSVLDKHTAVISYFVGDSSIFQMLITQNCYEAMQVRKQGDTDSLVFLLRAALSSFTPEASVKYSEIASLLYNQLFAILDTKTACSGGNNIKTLIIIPDKSLAMIPFEALLTSPVEKPVMWEKAAEFPYLISKYAIGYAYSATLFRRNKIKEYRKKSKTSGILAVAPVFDQVSGHFPDGSQAGNIPGTEHEVAEIASMFRKKKTPATVLLRAQAGETDLKNVDFSEYQYIHIASHGFVNSEKPELSGIVLASDTSISEKDEMTTNDGILFQGEILNLKLNSQLVVLSACETGLGKISRGEGVIGLTRALLYAGTKNIIVSLWPVADESTAKLMVDFYANTLSGKDVDFAGSLRKTKQKMISEEKFAHPFFWSPFVLIQ